LTELLRLWIYQVITSVLGVTCSSISSYLDGLIAELLLHIPCVSANTFSLCVIGRLLCYRPIAAQMNDRPIAQHDRSIDRADRSIVHNISIQSHLTNHIYFSVVWGRCSLQDLIQ